MNALLFLSLCAAFAPYVWVLMLVARDVVRDLIDEWRDDQSQST